MTVNMNISMEQLKTDGQIIPTDRENESPLFIKLVGEDLCLNVFDEIFPSGGVTMNPDEQVILRDLLLRLHPLDLQVQS